MLSAGSEVSRVVFLGGDFGFHIPCWNKTFLVLLGIGIVMGLCAFRNYALYCIRGCFSMAFSAKCIPLKWSLCLWMTSDLGVLLLGVIDISCIDPWFASFSMWMFMLKALLMIHGAISPKLWSYLLCMRYDPRPCNSSKWLPDSRKGT